MVSAVFKWLLVIFKLWKLTIMIEYKVRFMMDDNYEVVRIENTFSSEDEYDENEFKEESVYQGRLADCESYIRLKEGGYM